MSTATLPPKTPVSYLQEQCARKGVTPKYDLISVEGAVHEPTFVFCVSVGEITATGTGQSKKKAKHSAAKSVLEVLLARQDPNNPIPEPSDQEKSVTRPAANGALVLSQYDDGIPGNPVGGLQEFCMSRRWPPPSYNIVEEEGLPHERMFTMCCSVKKYLEKGNGKSKKLAKRQAAYKMLEKLKEIAPVKPENANNIDDDDEEDLNCVQFLQDIATEHNFDVTYVDIEERSKSELFQCLVQLSTLPVAVCHGTGPSAIDARTNAAENALEYLKLMTRE